MPTMWFVKDGYRPNVQKGASVTVCYKEIKGAFGGNKPEYISKEPPQFYVDSPSQYPVRVVIQVREEDGANVEFPKVGFYLIPGISPERAEKQLLAYQNRDLK